MTWRPGAFPKLNFWSQKHHLGVYMSKTFLGGLPIFGYTPILPNLPWSLYESCQNLSFGPRTRL